MFSNFFSTRYGLCFILILFLLSLYNPIYSGVDIKEEVEIKRTFDNVDGKIISTTPQVFDFSNARGQELEQKRTRNSKFYSIDSTKVKQLYFPVPIHYRNTKGNWENVDPLLVKTNNSRNYNFKYTNTYYRLYLKNNISDEKGIKIEFENNCLYFRFKGLYQKSEGEFKKSIDLNPVFQRVENGKLIYKDSKHNISIQVVYSTEKVNFIVKMKSDYDKNLYIKSSVGYNEKNKSNIQISKFENNNKNDAGLKINSSDKDRWFTIVDDNSGINNIQMDNQKADIYQTVNIANEKMTKELKILFGETYTLFNKNKDINIEKLRKSLLNTEVLKKIDNYSQNTGMNLVLPDKNISLDSINKNSNKNNIIQTNNIIKNDDKNIGFLGAFVPPGSFRNPTLWTWDLETNLGQDEDTISYKSFEQLNEIVFNVEFDGDWHGLDYGLNGVYPNEHEDIRRRIDLIFHVNGNKKDSTTIMCPEYDFNYNGTHSVSINPDSIINSSNGQITASFGAIIPSEKVVFDFDPKTYGRTVSYYITEDSLEISQPESKIVENINSTPSMPGIDCEIENSPGLEGQDIDWTCDIEYDFQVTDEDGNTAGFDRHQGSATIETTRDYEESTQGFSWDLSSHDPIGGEAEISAFATVDGEEYTDTTTIYIRGRNPGEDAVLAGLDAGESAMIQTEAPNYVQFSNEEYVNWGDYSEKPEDNLPLCSDADSMGWGMCQLDERWYDITTPRLWNWRENREAGTNEYDRHRRLVDDSLEARGNLNTQPNDETRQSMIDAEAYSQYNGGPDASYWHWNEKTNLWEEDARNPSVDEEDVDYEPGDHVEEHVNNFRDNY